MKTSMTPAAVHKQYTEGISAFQRHISGPDVRLGVAREADEFFRRCALGVWQADGAQRILMFMKYFDKIESTDAVPDNAILREFIGPRK